MKMLKKEEVISLLNSPMTVKLILSILKEEFKGVALPNNGHVAGQSVASAIMELLNIGVSPIYNDIDIFYLVSSELIIKNSKLQEIINKRNNSLSTFSNIYTSYDNYSQTSYVFDSYSYKVALSVKEGPLNKTYIEKYGYTGDSNKLTRTIIENFDINSTQVGFNIKTGKLVYTNEFVEFLMTKQLRVVKFNTPVHSYIRLAKKYQELKGTFVDIEEAKMLTMIYIHSVKNVNEAKKIFSLYKLLDTDKDINKEIGNSAIYTSSLSDKPLFFGERHAQEAQTFISKRLNDFIICGKGCSADSEFYSEDLFFSDAKSFYADNQCKNSFPVENDKINGLQTILTKKPEIYFEDYLSKIQDFGIDSKEFKEVIAHTKNIFYNANKENALKAINSGPEAIAEFDKSLNIVKNRSATFNYQIAKLQTMFTSLKRSKKSVKKFLLMGDIEKMKNGYLFKEQIFNSMFNGIEKLTLNSFEEFNKHANIMKGHIIEQFNLLSIDESVIFLKNLKKLKKEFGQIIFGYIETSNNLEKNTFLDYSLLKEFIEFKIDKDLEELKDSRISFTSKEGFSVNELISGYELKTEGEVMNHCVGGYASFVQSGECMIFKISGNSLRATIELRKNGDSYIVNQCRGKSNKPVDFKLILPVLEELNNKFKGSLLPLKPHTKSNFFNIREGEKYFVRKEAAPQVQCLEEENNPLPQVIDIDDIDNIPF